MGKESDRVRAGAAWPRDVREDVQRTGWRDADRASERTSREEAQHAFEENLDRSARAARASEGDGHEAKSVRDLKQLESDIKRTRRRLDQYVDELDRRRHRLMAVREHPWAAAGVGLGAIALVGGTVVLLRRRATSRRRVQSRSRSLRETLGRMLDHPERVASDGKSPWSRILVAVAPIVVKKIADAAIKGRKTRA